MARNTHKLFRIVAQEGNQQRILLFFTNNETVPFTQHSSYHSRKIVRQEGKNEEKLGGEKSSREGRKSKSFKAGKISFDLRKYLSLENSKN